MNDLTLINQWLNNPSRKFAEGLALYDRYKPNKKFDEFFRKNAGNPDSTTRNVLIHKLNHVAHLISSNAAYFEKMLIAQQTTQKPVSTIKTPVVKKNIPITDHAKIKGADLPEDLHKDFLRIQEITPILGGLHAKLRATTDNAFAKKIVDEISALDSEKRSLWGHIDQHTGKADDALDKKPVKAKKAQPDPGAKIKKQIQALRDSMNKRKKTLAQQKKTKPHLAKKTAVAIKQYQLKIADLENQLADIK